MATRILSVLNQKGGVGKTTTCVNLGAALARRGYRVLLIDMDPQANLTVHLGLEPPRLQRTSYSLLLGQHGLAEAVHETGVPGLYVVPSTLALANAEIQLAATVGRELVLREALEAWLDPSGNGNGLPFEKTEEASRPQADFVLIDCPPSLGTLTMNALCASGEVLLPIQTEFFALQGVAGILESVRAVQRLNRGLRLSLVVPSLVDLRTTLARDVIDEVRAYFGDVVTKTVIRKNVKLAEAPSHGKTIFEWDARCNGARDYEALAAEVLGEPLPEESGDAARRPSASPADEEDADEVPEEDGPPAPVAEAPEPEAPRAEAPAADAEAMPAAAEAPETTPPWAGEVASVEPEVATPPVTVSDETVSDETVSDETVSDETRTPYGDADEVAPQRSSGIGIAAAFATPEAPPAVREESAAPAPGPSPTPQPAPQRFVVHDETPAPSADTPPSRFAPPAEEPRAAPEQPADAPAASEPPAAERRASWWDALRRTTLGS